MADQNKKRAYTPLLGTKHWRNKRTGECTFSWYLAMQWAEDGDDVEAWLPDGLSEIIYGDSKGAA
ncbi:MAG: hypothetical protein IJV64_13725 [Oscillospiraceae bacterium]|nr:hypothetical protein [Oscillospiraceae bacterium]